MEKISRLPLSKIPSLQKLEDNWKQWGVEYKLYLQTKDEKVTRGQQFSWREGIYSVLKHQLEIQTDGHCSFCDGYPLEETSLSPIEHFYPKADFPERAYDWWNLFYCCDKCNSNANKIPFKYTLKPDEENYSFATFFYYDAGSGQLIVKENLKTARPKDYTRANSFLTRYGINSPKRCEARKYLFQDVKNAFLNSSDNRKRKHFKYRYVFDFVERLFS